MKGARVLEVKCSVNSLGISIILPFSILMTSYFTLKTKVTLPSTVALGEKLDERKWFSNYLTAKFKSISCESSANSSIFKLLSLFISIEFPSPVIWYIVLILDEF